MASWWGRLSLAGALLGLSACSDAPSQVVPQLRPVEGGRISSAFGPREVHPIKGPTPNGHHDGYDFAVAAGAPIRASMAGTVRFVGSLGGYGQAVVLEHAQGWSTLYGHASALKVKVGQKVAAGAVIALVGSTGISTGPHLHYELRKNGTAVDPGAFESDPLVAASLEGPLAAQLKLKRPARSGAAKGKKLQATRVAKVPRAVSRSPQGEPKRAQGAKVKAGSSEKPAGAPSVRGASGKRAAVTPRPKASAASPD